MAIDVGQQAHDEETVEVKRGSQGRLDLLLSRSDRSDGGLFVLHARLRPAARSFGHRFREGDALRMMGFTPRSQCHFFPVACFYGGCYFRVLGVAPTESESAAYGDQFDRVLTGLTLAVEQLVQAAWSAEELGFAIR